MADIRFHKHGQVRRRIGRQPTGDIALDILDHDDRIVDDDADRQHEAEQRQHAARWHRGRQDRARGRARASAALPPRPAGRDRSTSLRASLASRPHCRSASSRQRCAPPRPRRQMIVRPAVSTWPAARRRCENDPRRRRGRRTPSPVAISRYRLLQRGGQVGPSRRTPGQGSPAFYAAPHHDLSSAR